MFLQPFHVLLKRYSWEVYDRKKNIETLQIESPNHILVSLWLLIKHKKLGEITFSLKFDRSSNNTIDLWGLRLAPNPMRKLLWPL